MMKYPETPRDVNATTAEKLGAIGRKEGIMAFATVTVRLP